MSEPDKIRVLFLCTHNQARSQMAEGILRNLGKGRYEVFSAGSELADEVHPLAIKAMADIGIDISQQKPKNLEQYKDQVFDYIITTCDRVREACPVFPGDPERIHWNLPDPAGFQGEPREKQAAFDLIGIELGNRIKLLMQLPLLKRRTV